MTAAAVPGAPVREPPPARLVLGAIVADRAVWAAAEVELAAAFGPFEPVLLALPFDHTDYYRAEMGEGLLRVFRAFRAPLAQDALVDAKHRTAGIEALFADGSGTDLRRRVNIDPGIMTPASLVLASSKGYAHRAYLGRGVHAEVELVWRGGRFRPLEWTYPDYRREVSIEFFTRLRGAWMRELRGRAADRRAGALAAGPETAPLPVPAGRCS